MARLFDDNLDDLPFEWRAALWGAIWGDPLPQLTLHRAEAVRRDQEWDVYCAEWLAADEAERANDAREHEQWVGVA